MQGTFSNQIPSSVYLLIGNEHLLVRDWLDQLRKMLRNADFEDVQTWMVDSGFNWDAWLKEDETLSLFASKKCRILNITNGKPGLKGSKAIQAVCDNLSSDTVYVFLVPGLDAATKKSSWYRCLQKVATIVELKPVYAQKLPGWIQQRAHQKGLQIDQQSAAFLAECTEGNLLAADQELEKLFIRFAAGAVISLAVIEASVADSARYSHFVLVDACLAGQLSRALKILHSLETEGYVTTQLRWALQSVLEQLSRLKLAQSNGGLNDQFWQSLRIWQSKRRLYQQALFRISSHQIECLIQNCATLDRLSKGQQDTDFPDQDWLYLKSFIIQFCRSTQ